MVGLSEAHEHFKEVQPAPINAADRASIFASFDRLFLDCLPVALKKEDLPLPPAVAGVELEYLSKVQTTTSTEYLRHFQNRPADFGPIVLILVKALERGDPR